MLKLCRKMNRFFVFDVKRTSLINQSMFKHYKFCSTLATEEQLNDKETDEIEKKRDVSRLPKEVRQKYIKKEMHEVQYFHHYNLKKLQKDYAHFGKKSGINPGLMWPSKDYLQELKEYQSVCHTPLNVMLERIKEKEQEELEYRRQREETIEANMSKLDTWMSEFEAKQRKKQAEAEAQRLRKEKIIEDVQEYIGYKMDPKDERFKEVLQLKEEEEKKAKRKLKKQEREQKILAKLLSAAGEESPEKP